MIAAAQLPHFISVHQGLETDLILVNMLDFKMVLNMLYSAHELCAENSHQKFGKYI